MRKVNQRCIGIVMAVVMLMVSLPAMASEVEGTTLSANELAQGTLSSGLEHGIFQVMATAEKTVTIDGNSKVAEDGTAFEQRIKLGGSGNANYRSIHFSVTGASSVTVYAMSSSSSADRAVDLYGLDGTLVDSMLAPGAGLNMKTFAIEAGDYYLASPSSGVNVYGVNVEAASGFTAFSLGVSELAQEELVTSREVNGFTIAATAEKKVKIDGNEKTAEDGSSFSQRLKLGGSGSVDYRSIHFTTMGKAEVTVYAMSSSSSEDRAIDLYTLDGTLVETMSAPGSGLNMKTFTIEAGDYYLASPSSGVNVYGVDVKASLSAGFESYALGVSELAQEELSTSKEVNGITIAATAEKKVKIDSNEKTAEDGTSFSQRLKLGGSGSADYRSIHLSVASKAKVTVYAMSSSSSEDRALDLYGLDGTLIESMSAPGSGLNMKTFTVEAGDYYLASPSSGVNLYDVMIESAGGAVQVKRLDWLEVVAPVITDITSSGTTVEVAFDLVTGTDGADKAEVTQQCNSLNHLNKISIIFC